MSCHGIDRAETRSTEMRGTEANHRKSLRRSHTRAGSFGSVPFLSVFADSWRIAGLFTSRAPSIPIDAISRSANAVPCGQRNARHLEKRSCLRRRYRTRRQRNERFCTSAVSSRIFFSLFGRPAAAAAAAAGATAGPACRCNSFERPIEQGQKKVQESKERVAGCQIEGASGLRRLTGGEVRSRVSRAAARNKAKVLAAVGTRGSSSV